MSESFDISRVDEVVHGRVRLGAMAYLSGVGGTADFGDIKRRLATTDGDLSVHLSKLGEAGYVRIEKTYPGRKPPPRVHPTEPGREAFARYLEAIGALLAPTAQ